MKVQIKYRNGRLDVFDTDSYTPSQPFGDGCMLANYEAVSYTHLTLPTT